MSIHSVKLKSHITENIKTRKKQALMCVSVRERERDRGLHDTNVSEVEMMKRGDQLNSRQEGPNFVIENLFLVSMSHTKVLKFEAYVFCRCTVRSRVGRVKLSIVTK